VAAPQNLTHNPVKRRASRPWERTFLRGYAKRGIVLDGTRAAKIDRGLVYDRRKADPEFAKAMDAAYEEAADTLEAAALASPEPVLKIFMLKGMRPEKYRERFEHSGRVDHADVTTPEARDGRLVGLLATALARKAAASSHTETGS
jgi:hypothetical protein